MSKCVYHDKDINLYMVITLWDDGIYIGSHNDDTGIPQTLFGIVIEMLAVYIMKEISGSLKVSTIF